MEFFHKFSACLAALLICIAAVSGLRCWECENVYSQKECLARGRLVLCEETQNTCQITLRHGGWGPDPLIEKSCKQLSACGSNHIQDSHSASVFARDTQCSMKPPSSVCRCCCNTDGCNQDVFFCEELGYKLGGLPCKAMSPPRNGIMKCPGGSMPQSECTFTCKRGYKMVGSAISRCNIFSERDYPAPKCQSPRCKLLTEQRFGTVTCTNRNAYKSRCRFTCQEGYVLTGARMIECYEDPRSETGGSWSRPRPECRPIECMPQALANGRVICTDQRYVGSTCRFECNTERGYVVYPPTTLSNTCQRNANWTIPSPCCSLPCPPFAVMDFVVILDSSSSVGGDNWVKMKNFVRIFLSDFSVRDDATHFAVIRYNRAVDTKTQILLNDHPNSLDDVLEAYDRIPYDGSGTRTGAAIRYAANTLLTVGNRPFARDVVLLITDGASADDVVGPSNELHATGALVFVLPVQPPTGRIDLDEIETIARYPQNVLRDALEGGFDALDEAFAKRISGLLCGEPCDNLAQ